MTDLLPRRPRARRDRPSRAAARDRRRRDIAHRPPPRRPGSERRRLGRGARRPRALRREARRRRRGDARGARACASSASSSSGPVEPAGNGVIVSLVHPTGERTMCADRGVAPSSDPTSSTRPGSPTAAPPRLGLRAPARADPLRRGRAIEHARAAGARVSVDLSSWSAIRDFGADRFRAELEQLAPDVVFANEDEDEIVGGRSPAPRGSSSAAPPAPRSTATSAQPLPVEPSSTRRGPATPSPPAGSSAGRTSRSRPPPAACSRGVDAAARS